MNRWTQISAVALAFACVAVPARASTERTPVPFFLAPIVAPLQAITGAAAPPASAPPAVAPAATMAMRSEPDSAASSPPRTAGTRETVSYSGPYAPGTVVVNTSQRRLYFVLPGGRAIRYAIGVGREGFQWAGTQRISNKQEWPDWRPPEEMLRRRPDLPRYMAGGPHNPLGARALYLGGTLYRIHGSNEPETIGQAVSSGCIRMLNADVVDLYDRVKVGTQVVVLR